MSRIYLKISQNDFIKAKLTLNYFAVGLVYYL
jgi:hypothetical protein